MIIYPKYKRELSSYFSGGKTMKIIKILIFLIALAALLITGCTSAATPAPANKPAQAPAADTPTAPAPASAANTPPPPTQAAAAPAKADSPWQVVLEKEVKQGMRMAAFLDENFGLTGGPSAAGKAQYTIDGGKMWTMADTSSG
jgi:hypothetical protein